MDNLSATVYDLRRIGVKALNKAHVHNFYKKNRVALVLGVVLVYEYTVLNQNYNM